jgi:dolichyl-phosphate beta-glucosyltransferase
MLLSVVIPVYNEEKIIKGSVCRLTDYLRSLNVPFEVIISDDGSTDSGAGAVSSLSQKYSEIRLLCNPLNRGKGAAVRDGMLSAKGDFIIFTDCDLAYGESVIGDVFHRLQNGAADVIIGSRTLHPNGYEGYSPFRKAVSENYLKVLNRIMKISHSDFQCGLKGFTKEARDKIFPFCTVNGYAFDLEVLLLAEKKGLSVSEIPVKVLSEAKHKAKLKMLPEAIKMIRDVNKIKKGSTDLTRKGDGN